MKYKTVQHLVRSFRFFLILAVISFSFSVVSSALAQEIPAGMKEVFSVSGYPIPRFVSLEQKITNVRAGPGLEYPIRWIYKKQGLPVEVILEYGHWRKIRDYEDSEGWVYKTLLSGKRTALVMGEGLVDAYSHNPTKKTYKSDVSMKIEPLSLVYIKKCKGSVCSIEVSNLLGWIERKSLWGVYESENFD